MSVSAQELEAFFDYLRFPSISASPEHASDSRACADWLCDFLASIGLNASVRETGGAPAVVATTPPIAEAPTVLLYGHYDVQPVDPIGLWATPPFQPSIRGGLVHARGATDNKGQTFSHLVGLWRILARGPLSANLVVLVEGEEEVGSPHLGEFIRSNRELLACDVVLISDTSMVAPGWPALTLGLRGIACFEAAVRGPKADLHSGMFGGVIPNPALALARILARMHDSHGRIAISGLYDDVVPTPEQELAAWKLLPWDEAWFARTAGVMTSAGETGVSTLERVWARPTAEINGLTSGHQGAGSKTIIPASASAKLSFRLAPRQDPHRVAEAVRAWFQSELAAEGLEGEIEYDHGGLPFYTPPDNPFIAAARAALTEVFGRKPALTREGLSIPVAALLQTEFDAPVVLAGLGLPDCHAHSPNESYPLSHLDLGARTFAAMMRNFAMVR